MDSDREERRLIALAHDGDREAEAALLKRHDRLVRYWVKKYRGIGTVDTADLLQEGRVGLWKAIHAFDLEQGTRFGAYASGCIRSAIRDASKRFNRMSAEHLDESDEELAERKLALFHEDSGDGDEEAEVGGPELLAALESLSEQERQIVSLYFGLNDGVERTVREIAELVGRSKSTVNRTLDFAKSKLRSMLSNRSEHGAA